MIELIDELKDIKLAIFDLDGVIYRGDNLIPGADHSIQKIKELGIKVVFNSNNSTLTRQKYVEKLRRLNISCDVNNIYTSASITAEEIKQLKESANIFIIGEKGLREELKMQGHRIFTKIKDYKHIDYVIVGLDRKFTYKKLMIAKRCISQGKAIFYATNTDATLPDPQGELPGAGSMVAALERCTSEKPYQVFGKPSPLGINSILRITAINKEQTVIFGDRIDTDIVAGNLAGIKPILVLTGVTKKTQIIALKNQNANVDESSIPFMTINSLNDIFKN